MSTCESTTQAQIICPCGKRAIIVECQKSQTKENIGRRFVACPRQPEGCRSFISWLNELSTGNPSKSSTHTSDTCTSPSHTWEDSSRHRSRSHSPYHSSFHSR